MWGAIVGMVMSIVGGIRGGFSAENASNAQQKLIAEQSGQEMQAAQINAGLIRKMGKAQVGVTKSAAVKAGLDVNSTAVGDMVNVVESSAENDAMMALLTGERRVRALGNQMEIAKVAGKEGATQSILGGASSAMGTYSGMGGGK